MKRLIAHLFGDYIVQSDWMAMEKTKSHGPAIAHAASYAACFLPLTRNPLRLLIIGGTHYVIDHWRLAAPVVYWKNQAAPKEYRYPIEFAGSTGYHSSRPDWMTVWLMILADNAMHMLINELALRERHVR
jgi:Protein of unknown function (DUF3307)